MYNFVGLVVALVAIGAYIANIYKLITFAGAFGIEEAVRIIGILIPVVGAIMGFIG